MSVRTSVVCDQCGKDKPAGNAMAGIWLHIKAEGHAGIAFTPSSNQLVAHATLQVSRPIGSVALTGGMALDLCSRECAGAYFFGPVAT